MIDDKKIEIKPVDQNNWQDFEDLFNSKGGPSYCWCMAWRMTKEESKNNHPANRKTYIQARVWSKIPIGILAYLDKQAIAWCSVAPRETHQRLGGDSTLANVWSLTCFYIRTGFRDQGLVDRLIAHAKRYALENGAEYLEAYPVEPDSPSYRFMGFVKTFEKAGFRFVHKAGSRRHVMIYKLSE